MDLNAEVGGAAANSYLTLEEADERMNEFTHADRWDEIKEPDDKKRLLLRATRLVDRYKLWPPKMLETQRLTFPTVRELMAAIPDPVKTAVLEIVDAILDGTIEPLKKLQAEGVTSATMLGQTASFETDPSLMPAGARTELDRLWSTYNGPILQNRSYDGSDDEDGSSLFG